MIGCFVDTTQSPCGPGAYTLAEKETRKKTKKQIVKIQQAAAHDIICSSTWYFLHRTRRQKKQNRGKKNGEATTVVPDVHITSRTLWTTRPNCRWARLQKAATTRDRCVIHMCASAPAQRKNFRWFWTWSTWDHEGTNIVFRRSPDRGDIVLDYMKKVNRKHVEVWLFGRVRARQLSPGTYVPRVSCRCRNSSNP